MSTSIGLNPLFKDMAFVFLNKLPETSLENKYPDIMNNDRVHIVKLLDYQNKQIDQIHDNAQWVQFLNQRCDL